MYMFDIRFTDSSREFRPVKFVERPNVYFLSYDAIIPKTLAKKFLGFDSLPYLTVLESAKAHFIRNTFADAVATRFALSSVLRLRANRDEDPAKIVSGKYR